MVEKANDDVDWERIASGIFISDVMLIDWRQKCAIQAMGIDKLYSNRYDDVITLKDKLEQINMEWEKIYPATSFFDNSSKQLRDPFGARAHDPLLKASSAR